MTIFLIPELALIVATNGILMIGLLLFGTEPGDIYE